MNRQWHGVDLHDDDLLAMILHINEKLDAATSLLEAMRPPASRPDEGGLARALAAAEALLRSARADLVGRGLAARPRSTAAADEQ